MAKMARSVQQIEKDRLDNQGVEAITNPLFREWEITITTRDANGEVTGATATSEGRTYTVAATRDPNGNLNTLSGTVS